MPCIFGSNGEIDLLNLFVLVQINDTMVVLSLSVSKVGFSTDNVLSPFLLEKLLNQQHTKSFIKGNIQHSIKMLKSKVTFIPHLQNSTWLLFVLVCIKGRHPAHDRSYCLLHLDPSPRRNSHNVKQVSSRLRSYLCHSESMVYPDEGQCVIGTNFQVTKCLGGTLCFGFCSNFKNTQ